MSWICPSGHACSDDDRRCATCGRAECGCPDRAAGEHKFGCVTGSRAISVKKVHAPLAIGAEVVTILTEVVGKRSRSGTRRNVIGVARGRVVAVEGDVYQVKILTSSQRSGYVGRTLELRRAALHDMSNAQERAAFEADVRRFWPPEKM